MQVEEERYGDAVLTRLPMRRIRAGSLPHWRDLPGTEPRGAIWVEVEVDGTPVQIFNTHLSLRGRDRKQQVDALLGPEWLGHKNCRNPVILCGDLNALPRSYVYKRLSGRLSDAQGLAQDQKTRATFATRFPTARIDHVFVDSSLEVRAVEVPNNHLSRMASDHLPLVVELRLSKVQSATRSSRARPCRETRGG
jgi:endonuclease/exonuclease/phosphatase family metal-dependent hydrolase